MADLLRGRRILVLEDEFLAALDMKEMLEERGGTVVGPVGRLDQALALAQSERLDLALLDVSLDGDTSFAVADALIAQGVPVIFATGYDWVTLPDRFATSPKLSKPYGPARVEKTLELVLQGR
jgi:CheY-like chemotaxis protein